MELQNTDCVLGLEMRHGCDFQSLCISKYSKFKHSTSSNPPYPTRLCPSSIHLLKCLTLIGSRKFHCSVYFFFLTLLENVLIENGPKVLCPSYHRYTSQFIATSLAPPFMPRPSLSPLMMLQRNLKIIETKEMRGPYKWQRTKQAERKERQDAKLTVLDATTSAECE